MSKQLMQETKVYTFYDFEHILYTLKEVDKDSLLHFDITKQETEMENQVIPFWIVSITSEGGL